jgi:3-oxoadipate enol-lactonase
MTSRFAVELQGTGTPVVLIHGLGGTSNVFGPQVAALAKWCQCLRPDLPGSGRSPSGGALTIRSLMHAVLTILDDHGMSSAHFVGHSLGTLICQHIAVNAPDRVRSLVLIGPMSAPPDPARQALRARAAKARQFGMVEIADTIIQVALAEYSRLHRPEVVAFVRELLMRQNPEDYARTCEALADATAANLAEIRCPTLLIVGDSDSSAPPPAVRQLARELQGAELCELTRCGHWATLEDPGALTSAMESFLKARSSGG